MELTNTLVHPCTTNYKVRVRFLSQIEPLITNRSFIKLRGGAEGKLSNVPKNFRAPPPPAAMDCYFFQDPCNSFQSVLHPPLPSPFRQPFEVGWKNLAAPRFFTHFSVFGYLMKQLVFDILLLPLPRYRKRAEHHLYVWPVSELVNSLYTFRFSGKVFVCYSCCHRYSLGAGYGSAFVWIYRQGPEAKEWANEANRQALWESSWSLPSTQNFREPYIPGRKYDDFK